MKDLKKILSFAMAGLMVVALIMIFLPAIKVGEETYNGLKVAFGYTSESKVLGVTVSIELFKFSFMNLLTYLFVIVSIVLAALQIVKKNDLFTLGVVVTALLAGVFFLLTKNFVILKDANFKELFNKNSSIGVGPIIGAVCSFLTVGCGVVKTVISK